MSKLWPGVVTGGIVRAFTAAFSSDGGIIFLGCGFVGGASFPLEKQSAGNYIYTR